MSFDPLAFIARHEFRRARATANPHEYIVRGKVRDDEGFDALIRHIHAHGVERAWGMSARSQKIYIVWYAPDGHHYWTMGWPVRETVIINRAISSGGFDQTVPVDGRPLRYSSADGRKPVL
jgi:hypothetical protein